MRKDELMNAIGKASKALQGRTCIQKGLSLSATNGTLTIAGASNAMRIIATIPCEPELDFAFNVDASLFSQVVTRLPSENIQLTKVSEGLKVSCDYTQMVLSVCEFVPVKDNEDEYQDPIVVQNLETMTAQVVHALGDPNLNPMMGALNVCVYDGGKLQIAALDGHRVSIRKTANKKEVPAAEFNVYGREMAIALKMIGDEDIAVQLGKTTVRIEKEGLVMIISLVDGKYFNLASLFQRNAGDPICTTVDKDVLVNTLELVQLISPKVLIDLTETDMLFTSKDILGCTELHVPVMTSGLEEGRVFKISFNTRFLLDAIRSIPADEIAIRLLNPNTQMTLYDGQGATELVLPVYRAD